MLRRIGRCLSARLLLSTLLLIDAGLIALYIGLWWTGAATMQFDIESDGGVPERFQYLKWAACVAACAYMFHRRRTPLYLAWAALFGYFLADDALQLHEKIGTDAGFRVGYAAYRPQFRTRSAQ
jgi:hypothetical protein